MLLSVVSQSSTGPKRERNEDYLGYWQPSDQEERIRRGTVAVIADGLGGLRHGDVACRLAVENAPAGFEGADPAQTPQALMKNILTPAKAVII
jgi:serine/threonine protein phosphatase PrpC